MISNNIDKNLNLSSTNQSRLANPKNIKFIQGNLDKSFYSQQEFIQYFAEMQYDMALVSEPYTSNTGAINSISGVNIYQFKTTDRIKAAVLVKSTLGATIGVSQFSTSNLAIVSLRTNKFKLYIISVYIEPREDPDSTLNKLELFIKHHPHANIIIGGDFNGWHPQWGSIRANKRGKDLIKLITTNDLIIGNIGTDPTFEATTRGGLRTSIIDLSIFANQTFEHINNWKINNSACPSSQHHSIEFNFSLDTKNKVTKRKKQSTYKYNTNKANWIKFKTILRNKMESNNLHNEPIHNYNTNQIEQFVTKLTTTIQNTCDESLRPKINNFNKIQWWNEELEQLKKKVIKLHHTICDLKKGKKPLDNILKERAEMKEKYINAISKASNTNFREFCTKQNKENVWSVTNRLLKCGPKPIPPSSLRKTDGTYTTSPEDTAFTLLQKFYPNDTDDTINTQMQYRAQAKYPPQTPNDRLFTTTEIISNLNSINPKKAPGPDHLTADICLQVTCEYPEAITKLLNCCLTIGYFPTQWKVAHIIAFPKPNKNNHKEISAYRPIGLLNVFGKLLEKLIAQRLRHHININDHNNPNQFGFKSQTSTIDAIRAALNKITTAKHHKNQIIAASLDIQAAFDNAWWPVLFKRLKTMRCPRNLYVLIQNYMENRTVKFNYVDITLEKIMTRGCIQGSVLGPLFWNITLDDLFDVELPSGCYIQAFADDIFLIAENKNVHILELNINSALKRIFEWGRKVKLTFGPEKTQIIPFTSKAKHIKITISNKTIEHVHQIKLLGVIIDSKLKFIQHVKYVTQRALKIFRSICKFVRPTWGISSESIKIIYNYVIEPTITYAAGIWGDAIKYKTVCDALKSMQRMFALRIIRGFRTVSATAAIALSTLTPLHLKIKEVKDIETVKHTSVHNSLPKDITLEKHVPTSQLLHPADRIEIEINKAITTQDIVKINQNISTYIYTDGSKFKDDKVGAAFVAYSPDDRHTIKKFRLHPSCTVYQAELYAIKESLKWVTNRKIGNITVLTDSLSALTSINNRENTNPLVATIHKYIFEIRKVGSVVFVWTKAHVGLYGNEAADMAAKSAANSQIPYNYNSFPISYVKNLIKNDTIIKTNEEYVAAETGRHTRSILNNIEIIKSLNNKINLLPSITQFYLTQYLTRHGFHLEYLNKFIF